MLTAFCRSLSVGLTGLGPELTAFLIFVLAFKEVASASDLYDLTVDSTLNSLISSMFIVFVAIVIMKTIEIIY